MDADGVLDLGRHPGTDDAVAHGTIALLITIESKQLPYLCHRPIM
jgi:hypothetical protein